jgi:anthranilate synthase component 1
MPVLHGPRKSWATHYEVKDGTMHVQAGGGIVADSQPQAEFEESRPKGRALLRAAQEAVRFAADRGRGNR